MMKNNYVIRFRYCPPNPGPKRKLYNKWFTKVEDAIEEYNGETIYISYNKKPYKEITFEYLIELHLKNNYYGQET
jgi:alpha-L-fucosidase